MSKRFFVGPVGRTPFPCGLFATVRRKVSSRSVDREAASARAVRMTKDKIACVR
jgi:hypothetical protein